MNTTDIAQPLQESAATDTAATTLNRSVKVPARSEDASLINCREIEDWCGECRSHRAPVLSATTAFIGAFGLFVGLVSGVASTDRPGWHAVFLAGTLLSALVMIASAIAIAVGWKRGDQHGPMHGLAERMDRAKNHNRVPAEEEVQTISVNA